MDSYEVINYISGAEKKTPVKIYLQGDLNKINFGKLDFYGSKKSGILFCEHKEFIQFLERTESIYQNTV